MTDKPFNLGGYLKAGRVLVASAGTEPVLTDWQWTAIGNLGHLRPADISPTISRATMNFSTPITLHPLPFSRREKRNRNAFIRVLWGGPLPKPAESRQLIHNGGKP